MTIVKPMTADEIRESFLSFFESKDHLRLPSFSLVPVGDPTLLIIGAGMAPMKSYFKGEAIPPRQRITTCQKCIRVGDIEQVGRTARHHTFFEMLGNFSFGDYFKKEAIKWGWEYVTEVLHLPPEKLYVTIHTDDDVAEQLWISEVGIPKDRIYRLADNFWGPVGNTGPCGPCSEILIDKGPELACGPDCNPSCDCDRYLEIWNLVFTGLNKNEAGEYEELPKPCIDTGAGFDRIVAFMQGKKTAFETDLFERTLDKITEMSGKKLGMSAEYDIAIKVIADHIRALVFMASDGITPSNEGRGYVMRRLLRRSLRKAQDLGFGDRSLSELVDPVINRFAHIYPEVNDKREFSISIISNEEDNFKRTLNQGMQLLDTKLKELSVKGEKILAGKDVFNLYDTYGFPNELTQEIAEERGFRLDMEGFEAAMEEQRERARAVTKSKLEAITADLDFTKYESRFTGYGTVEEKTRVVAMFVDGKEVAHLFAGDEGDVIFAETCFYGEAGGQIGDTGAFESNSASGEVLDTRSTAAKVNLHHIKVIKGDLLTGDQVTLKVDTRRRGAIKRHHTATHLLQSALRTVLGSHVGQLGSLVDENRLRFDFSHHQAMTREEIDKVEDIVNGWIVENCPVKIKELPVNEALNTGAIAFFGEKYGDFVRVVSVPNISSELCGGTHVDKTGDIGCFKIISEGGVATGTRRIEAVCGLVASKRFQEEEAILRETANMLTVDFTGLPQAVARLLTNIKALEKDVRNLRMEILRNSVGQILSEAQSIGDVKVVTRTLEGLSREDLKTMADLIAQTGPKCYIVLGSVIEGNAALLVRLTDDLVKAGHSAVPVIKAIAPMIEGSGGGKPHLAQAGGRNALRLDEAVQAGFDVIKKLIEK